MIYLDLDGVLTDWESGVLKLFETPLDGYKSTYGENIHDYLGVTKGELWKRINRAGEGFWSNLQPLSWARELHEELSRMDEVVILTSPSAHGSSAAGKVKWMKDFFGHGFEDYIITPRKELLAKPENVLIDDREKKVDAFTREGGIGILFPRPYNRSSAKAADPMWETIDTLQQIYPHYRPREYDEANEMS